VPEIVVLKRLIPKNWVDSDMNCLSPVSVVRRLMSPRDSRVRTPPTLFDPVIWNKPEFLSVRISL